MGRTYLFECPKCSYQAKVAGGVAEGADLSVETIHCLDCTELYDAVTAIRVPLSEPVYIAAPSIVEVMNRLAVQVPSRWERFDLSCPVDHRHEWKVWTQPGKCPRCGVFIEPSAIPFRQWD